MSCRSFRLMLLLASLAVTSVGALAEAPLQSQSPCPPVPEEVTTEAMAQALLTASRFTQQAINNELNTHVVVSRDNLLHRQIEPQLREFLKDQMYCMTLGIAPGAMWKTDLDFGPVDYSILKDANTCSRGDWKGRTHELALKKHGLTKPIIR